MSEMLTDRFASARAVADAVLYEGYVLYPYRASSRKNQARFQFGVLTPRAFSEADGSERWAMRTECLIDPGGAPRLSLRLRFLQVQHRFVEEVGKVAGALRGAGELESVQRLEVDGRHYVAWDEALDRVVDISPFELGSGASVEYEQHFALEAGTDAELIRSADGSLAGRIVRERECLSGRVLVAASPDLGEGIDDAGRFVKIVVIVENTTTWTGSTTKRDAAMGQSLVAVHTMLAVDDGSFVSLLDPPEEAARLVAACQSDGTFPVLIGADDVMLSSPIILYDHPEVAPESPGDLYDATEIDEILALRIMTLTDEEKSEARGTDPRAAAIIDRCDEMSPETWERLHGTMRSTEREPVGSSPVPGPATTDEPSAIPWWDPAVDAAVDPWTSSIVIGGVRIAKGVSVKLRPSHRADAQDFFLAGLRATVAGVFTDVDGSEQVAVTIDDDPATEELAWQGRYLFFHPDEVEPVGNDREAS
jgi:hypothetical protein